jgi:hypothetical protein
VAYEIQEEKKFRYSIPVYTGPFQALEACIDHINFRRRLGDRRLNKLCILWIVLLSAQLEFREQAMSPAERV